MNQCIECRRPKSAHAADGACPWEYKTRYKSLDLPAGMTCSDCQHVRFCLLLIGDVSKNTNCDWYPIRFVPKVAK